MARQGRWFVGGLVALVAFTLGFPDLRLARELAAARREGLWTTPGEVRKAAGTAPEGETALPLVRLAHEAERGLVSSAEATAIAHVADGTAAPAERRLAQAALRRLEPTLAIWERASRRARLVPDRNYEDGFGTLYPELAPAKGAVVRLVASAYLGERPHEPLLAAARLAALMRREPDLLPAVVGTDVGLQTLRAAERLGFAKEVEAALGPPPDVRRVLGPELPAFLASADYRRYVAGLSDLGLKDDIPWTEHALHYGPLARNTQAAGVARWRDLWRRLPRDGRDYDGAAKVVDAELPKLDPLMPSYADVMTRLLARSGDPGRGAFLRTMGELERARAAVRAAP